MARCPDCNKFVSYGEPEVEVDSEDVNGTTLTASVRIALTCGDCGTELKEASPDFEAEVEHDCEAEVPEGEDDIPEFEVENIEGTGDSRVEDKDRNGKRIKNPRYMKTYYGADITATVKCLRCNEEIEIEGKVEEQASGFEEM